MTTHKYLKTKLTNRESFDTMQYNEIKTKINTKWVDEHGILWMKVLDGAHIDLPSLLDDYERGLELIENREVYAIYDATPFFTITAEARDYLNSGVLNKNRKATAVITSNLAVRLLVNFMNRFKQRQSPLNMFPDQASAFDWIMTLMEKEKTNSELLTKTDRF